jgi:polar amino acid transport system substrate-binding protein
MAVLLPALSGFGCGDLPRDPKHTLSRVLERKKVRVGLVENPPWVLHGADGPAGAEVVLARRFAESLGATPEWFWGGEQRHMEALENFEMDLLIGGLEASTPWSKKVGLTRPYFVERMLVGIPPGSPAPVSLKGQQIAVKAGDDLAASVQKKGAEPLQVPEISPNVATAAADWRIAQLGLVPTRFELGAKRHIVAVPPGENGWLRRIQIFLATQRGDVPGLLQRAGTGQ